MNKKAIIIGLILAVALGGGLYYRANQAKSGDAEHAEHKEAGHKEEKAGGHEEDKEHEGEKEGHEGHDEHGEAGSVKMAAEVQKLNGVVVAAAKKQQRKPFVGRPQECRTGG